MWIGATVRLSAQVYVDLGETNLDALKVAGVGVDGTAFLSADEGAIYDMASLPLVRVRTADFEGGNPVKARLLTKDVTGPSLLRANFAGDDLVLDFDEPVVVADAMPRLVSIVDEDGEGDPLDALVPVSGARRGRNAKRRVILDLKDRCSADEVCRIKIITECDQHHRGEHDAGLHAARLRRREGLRDNTTVRFICYFGGRASSATTSEIPSKATRA